MSSIHRLGQELLRFVRKNDFDEVQTLLGGLFEDERRDVVAYKEEEHVSEPDLCLYIYDVWPYWLTITQHADIVGLG